MTDEERQKLIDDCRNWPSLGMGHLGQLIKDAADEIERLAEERDQFAEQLAIRSESGMAKDMQEIMRINNEQADEIKRLAALIQRLAALAQSDAEPVKWQWRGKCRSGDWSDWADGIDGDFWDRQPSASYERRNLYAAPLHRPTSETIAND